MSIIKKIEKKAFLNLYVFNKAKYKYEDRQNFYLFLTFLWFIFPKKETKIKKFSNSYFACYFFNAFESSIHLFVYI